jgi:hypothetical protein
MPYEVGLVTRGRKEVVEKLYDEVSSGKGPWTRVLACGTEHDDPMGLEMEYSFFGPKRVLQKIVQRFRDQGVEVNDPSPAE